MIAFLMIVNPEIFIYQKYYKINQKHQVHTLTLCPKPKQLILKKLFTNLTFWVLAAITSGALLGHFYPEMGIKMQPLGKYFIEVVKVFINPIIFITISLGISGMNDLKKVGRVGGKAILYFEIVTTFALLI